MTKKAFRVSVHKAPVTNAHCHRRISSTNPSWSRFLSFQSRVRFHGDLVEPVVTFLRLSLNACDVICRVRVWFAVARGCVAWVAQVQLSSGRGDSEVKGAGCMSVQVKLRVCPGPDGKTEERAAANQQSIYESLK